MNVTDNPVRVTWTVRGVNHDKVQILHNVPPYVTCGDDCCCKSSDPATYFQAHKDDPDEWGDPVPPPNGGQ